MAKKKEEIQTQKCPKCGKQQTLGKYIENSQWCNPCRKKYIKTPEQLEKFCNEFYLTFNVDIWNQAIEKFSDDEPKAIGKYFSLMNMSQNKSSKVNTEENNIEEDNEEININIDLDFEITKDMVVKWGNKFSKNDYWYLENEYYKLINTYESDTPVQQMIYEEIAKTRLDIRKGREKKQNVDKYIKTLQELLGSGNIKPVQETGANSLEQASFGTLIKKWEEEKPIPEPLEEFKDVDGIKRYVETWFFGHLSKMLNIENSNSQLYEQEMLKYTVVNPSDDIAEGDV